MAGLVVQLSEIHIGVFCIFRILFSSYTNEDPPLQVGCSPAARSLSYPAIRFPKCLFIFQKRQDTDGLPAQWPSGSVSGVSIPSPSLLTSSSTAVRVKIHPKYRHKGWRANSYPAPAPSRVYRVALSSDWDPSVFYGFCRRLGGCTVNVRLGVESIARF